MKRDEFEDLLNEYGKSKQEVTAASEWGTGGHRAERDALEYRALILLEYDAMTAEVTRLREALMQYSDKDNWMNFERVPIPLGEYSDVWGHNEDGYERASRALEGDL